MVKITDKPTLCESDGDCKKFGKGASCEETDYDVSICMIWDKKDNYKGPLKDCTENEDVCGSKATCVAVWDDEDLSVCVNNKVIQQVEEGENNNNGNGNDVDRSGSVKGDAKDAKYGRCVTGGPVERRGGRLVDKWMSAEYGGRRGAKYGYHCKPGMDMVESGVPGGGCACCETPNMGGVQKQKTYGTDRCGHVTPHVGRCRKHGKPWSYVLKVGSAYTCANLPIEKASKFVAGGKVTFKG